MSAGIWMRFWFYLFCFAARRGAERVCWIVVTVESTVQMLCCCREVIYSHLLPRDATAALRVDAVPTTLLITWKERGQENSMFTFTFIEKMVLCVV